MPIAFEIQQGLPCVFTNLPNLISIDAKYRQMALICSGPDERQPAGQKVTLQNTTRGI